MRLERVLLKVQLFDEGLAELLWLGPRRFVSLLDLADVVGPTCAAASLNGNRKLCYCHTMLSTEQ